MKYFILLGIVFIQLSCATQNSSSNQHTNTIQALIKNGQPVSVENQTFDEAIDFTSFIKSIEVSQGIGQVHINSGIAFKNCVFKKPVTAFKRLEDGQVILSAFKNNLTFIGCTFKSDVNFRGSSIDGRVDFSGSTFQAMANFEELSCHENVFFNGCIFEKELRFQNSFFQQKANFMNAEFYGISSFQSSTFNSEFQCSATKFFNYADMTLLDCRGRVILNYAEFREQADFGHAVFSNDFDFISTKTNTTSFKKCRFLGQTRFDKTEVKSLLNLEDSYFLLQAPKFEISSDKIVY